MSMEDYPSLETYKDGMPPKLPDPSRKRRQIWYVIIGLSLLSLVLITVTFVRSGNMALLAGTGTIAGTVYDDRGQPIVAEIYVFGTPLAGVSDQAGRFTLRDVPAGEQVMVVGYRNVGREQTIKVVAGQVVEVGDVRFEAEDFENAWSQMEGALP